MTIIELCGIIEKHGKLGRHDQHRISGCELLEHISDVEGFVELLRKFSTLPVWQHSRPLKNFVDSNPKPIDTILDINYDFYIKNAGEPNSLVCISANGINWYFCSIPATSRMNS